MFVKVFERSEFKNEAGAAVSIPPNGGRILNHWNFDSAKAGGIDNMQVRRPKGDTLEPMAPTLSFANVKEKYGTRWLFYHRVDMHRTLRELAMAEGAVIHLGHQVVDVDVDAGIIHVKGDKTFQKDLVVIADGQHDQVNVKVTGKEVPMQRSGQTAFRCLIPMEDIMKDDETKGLFENQPPGFWAPALPAKGVMVVTYPCRDNKILNVLAVCRSLATHGTSEQEIIKDWNYPASHEDLEKVLDGFHPHVKKAFLKAPEVKVYTQMKRQPLNRMTKGKVVLIGDACHPMLLTHAQGVSSSIEDAAALELFLDNLPSSLSVESPPSDVLTERLQQFEKFRLGRVSATQILTEPVIPGPQAAENYKKQEAVIRQYYDGPLPPTGSVPHSPGICDFFFGYDVRKEAQQFLQENPLTTLSSTLTSTPPPTSVASTPVPASLLSHPADFQRQQPLTQSQQSTQKSQAIVVADAYKTVQEAQTAIVAAQAALAQAQESLVAAHKALESSMKNLTAVSSPSPAAMPFPQKSVPIEEHTEQNRNAPQTRPTKPKKMKSFENLKNRFTGVFTGSLVTVKEITPSSEQHQNAVKA